MYEILSLSCALLFSLLLAAGYEPASILDEHFFRREGLVHLWKRCLCGGNLHVLADGPILQEGGAKEGGADARESSEEEVSKRVLAILSTTYNPDSQRGSWQDGAFETEVLTNLALLKPTDFVRNTLMKVIEGQEPSHAKPRRRALFEVEGKGSPNYQQWRLALFHVADAAPGQLVSYLIEDLTRNELKTFPVPTDHDIATWRLNLTVEMETLGRMGEGARAAIPVLIEKLNDRDREVSEAALRALVKIGPQSPEIIAALSAHFDRSDVVYEAARYGELARPLGTRFVRALQSKESEIRTWAALGLVKSGFQPSEGLDFLIHQVEEGATSERELSLSALGALGSDAKPVLEKLRARAKSQTEAVAREIGRTIDRIEKNDRILTHAEEADKWAAARKASREAIAKLLRAQSQSKATPLPGLEFLASYPKLKNLSLSMTEKDFFEIAKKEKLNLCMELAEGGSKYLFSLGDGQALMVMFRKQGDACAGIQRIRADDIKEPTKTESPSSRFSDRPNDLKFTGQLRQLPLREALQWLANAEALDLQIDEDGVRRTKLNLHQPVNLTVKGESPREILERLIDWKAQNRIVHDIRGGKLHVTTIAGHRKLIQDHLPDWLRVLNDRGSQGQLGNREGAVQLDENNEVIAVHVAENLLTEERIRHLATLPKLTRLKIDQSDRWTFAALDLLTKFPRLQVLDVSGIRKEGKGLGDEAIRRLVMLKSLSELKMSGCEVTDSGVKELENIPSLKKLSLGGERLLTDAALASMGRMKQLKSLDLECRSVPIRTENEKRPSSFTESGLQQLTGVKGLEELNLIGRPVSLELLDFPKLKSLSLNDFFANDHYAIKIAQTNSLKCLVILNTSISDRGIASIAELPNLTKLHLASSCITDDGIGHLQKMKKLQEISLQSNQWTDLALKKLARIKTLNRVEIDGLEERGVHRDRVPRKRFTSWGVQQLRMLPDLQTLALANVQFLDGFWDLKEFTQLNELILSGTNISEEEIDLLEEALPGTRIRGDGPFFSRRRK